MTREEAIKHLEYISVCSENHVTMAINSRDRQAIDMAIEALSWEPSEDAVSRKAAIDVEGLDEEIRCEMCKNQMNTDRGCNGNCKYDEKLYEKIIQILDRRIKSLPSAQSDFDIIVKIDKAYDDGYEAGYLQGRHDWGDLDE